jgi:hypothetical protein
VLHLRVHDLCPQFFNRGLVGLPGFRARWQGVVLCLRREALSSAGFLLHRRGGARASSPVP